MSVGILIITHSGLGSALLSTAQRLLGHCELNTQCVDVPVDAQADAFIVKLKRQLTSLDQGQGVLILTDAYGATPSNIACSLSSSANAEVVSGLNLPMLIRICNYRRDNLEKLAKKAASGAISGVKIIQNNVALKRANL